MNASTAPMSNALTPEMGDIAYIKTLDLSTYIQWNTLDTRQNLELQVTFWFLNETLPLALIFIRSNSKLKQTSFVALVRAEFEFRSDFADRAPLVYLFSLFFKFSIVKWPWNFHNKVFYSNAVECRCHFPFFDDDGKKQLLLRRILNSLMTMFVKSSIVIFSQGVS